VGAAYVVGYRRLSHRRHDVQAARTRAGIFAAGYLTLVVALVSPLHALGEDVFSLHMVQHLLLTLVAAPLLLLSRSMPVLLWALPPPDRAAAGWLVSHEGPIGRVLRVLTRPAIAWLLFVLSQWGWHMQGAYQAALDNVWLHYVEHISFFGAALLFWWPVIGAAPLRTTLSYPARLLYTFLAWLPNSLLGAGITFSSGVLYAHYLAPARALGLDPLGDQQLAGLIMWIPGDLLFLGILLLLLAAYLRDEEREAIRQDRELDALEARGLPLPSHIGRGW
jgi:cytochrome c oxidase assembly factor CtaG